MPRSWHEAMERARRGEIAFLDHPWRGRRILKVLCKDKDRLLEWGKRFDLTKSDIHDSRIPHFDLQGERRLEVLHLLR